MSRSGATGWVVSRAAGFAALALVMAALSSNDARAAFIEGTIGFGGQWIPRDNLGNITTIQGATMVDVVNERAIVTAGSGDFSGMAFTTFADYNDFRFNPFVPSTPLWLVPQGIGTFSFDLLTIAIDVQTSSTLGLIGSGLLKGVGFQDTAAVFSFTGDGNGGTFTFSNSGSTTSIPEPQTLGLFGVGLLGIGLLARRRQSVGVRAWIRRLA